MTQTKIPRFVTGIQRRRVNSGSSQVDRIQCLRALFAPLLSSKRTRNIISFRIGEKRSSNFARILRAKNIDRRYFSKAEGRRGFQFERAVPRNLVPRRRNFGIGIRKFFSRCSPCINLPLSLHFSPVLALPSPTLVHRFNPPLPGFFYPPPRFITPVPLTWTRFVETRVMKESARLRGRRNGPRPLFGSSFNFCGLNFSIVDRRWHGRSMNIRTGRVPVPSKFWRFLFFFSFLFRAERKVFCFVRWKRIRWMEEILWKSKMKSCSPSSMRFELLYKFCVRFFYPFLF